MNLNSNENAGPDEPAGSVNPDLVFEVLQSESGKFNLENRNTDSLFDHAIKFYADSRSAMEMFEAMKMRLRSRLDLPIFAAEDEPRLSEDRQRRLESGLLDACRQAGTMLVQDGKIAEGWMYLRVLDDKDLARELLTSTKITEHNYDEMIQVLLHDGVDVGRGFRAVIEHQGTCNSVTLFDQTIASCSKKDRQAAATELLNHFYDELFVMVRNDVLQREEAVSATQTDRALANSLGELLLSNPWLLKEGGYHLDTTHLSAVVRNASVLESAELLQKARELVQYGRGLHHEFQYPGDEPFVDFYPAYAVFYDVLLGVNVDAGLKIFQRKAETVDTDQHGTVAMETYVDLLYRIGRHRDAVYEAIRLVPGDVASQAVVTKLLPIALETGDPEVFDRIAAYCRKSNDVLGFTAAMHAKHCL